MLIFVIVVIHDVVHYEQLGVCCWLHQHCYNLLGFTTCYKTMILSLHNVTTIGGNVGLQSNVENSFVIAN